MCDNHMSRIVGIAGPDGRRVLCSNQSRYTGMGICRGAVMSQLNYFELCDMLVPGRETCKIIVCCTLAVRLSS